MSTHPMAAADAAWLRMDRPNNLMVVTSVMWFDEPVDRGALLDLVRDRLVGRFPRFRQRAVDDGEPRWEDVEEVDLDAHVHTVRLPGRGTKAQLEQLTSELVSVPLDRQRPLWSLHLVENYGPGSAVVFRVHHAVADGIALAGMLLSLTDGHAGPEGHEGHDSPAGDSRGPAAGAAVGALLRAAVQDPAHLVDRVVHAGPRLLGRIGAVVEHGAAAVELALLRPDRPTALRGRPGVSKRVVWSDPLPLKGLHDLAHAADATVNDLLLSAVAGALRSHLVRRRSPVHDIRAIVPFNLRPPGGPSSDLGNRFGLVYLRLPLTMAAREDRLRAVVDRTRRVKRSAQGPVSYAILELVGRAPAFVEDLAIGVFAGKGTGVMTNVPGPRTPVTLAGSRLAGSIGWGPTSGDLGLGVALFSLAGTVVIGLYVDEGLVPEPEVLLRDTLAELDGLRASVGQRPNEARAVGS